MDAEGLEECLSFGIIAVWHRQRVIPDGELPESPIHSGITTEVIQASDAFHITLRHEMLFENQHLCSEQFIFPHIHFIAHFTLSPERLDAFHFCHHQTVDVKPSRQTFVKEIHDNRVNLCPSHKAHHHQFCEEPHVLSPLAPEIIQYLFHYFF